MKMRLACVFAWLLAAIPAQAVDAPPAARAFEALPDSDRKALQEALGWLGFYNGVVDGAFGKRTTDALAAYQQSVGAPSDGIVTQKGLAALKDGAAKAKAAVGFRLIDDPFTGVRIGAPMKLLEKRDNGEASAALTSKDGKVGLYLRETSGSLAALYKTFSADTGARKVTYKVLKADAFFVTAGEDGDNKFYRRYAAPPGGGGDVKLRGFAFIYPKARAKALDPVALAIANAFDPFPATAAPAPAPTPAPPPPPKLVATALVVAPGVAVTALDPAGCKTPTIEGKPARYLDSGAPLLRLGGDFGAGATAIPVGDDSDDLVALSLAGGGAHPTLEAATAASVPGAQGKVLAALGASGGPLFDRQGRVVGFVAPAGRVESRAGVVLAAPRAFLKAAALGEASAEAGASLPAAAIARLRRSAIVGVFCAA